MSSDVERFAKKLKDVQVLIYKSRFDEALVALDVILKENPDHADTLYMSAVCHRYVKQNDQAFATLNRLKTVSPEFGRAYQEEGHLYRQMGKASEALKAFERACLANPALEASWRAQADLLSEMGRNQESNQALFQANRLAALPKELVAVTNFIHEGKTLKAESLCRHFLKNHPHHIEAMRLLAEVGARFGILDEAEFLLESAVEFDSENIQVRLDYIQILRKRQKFQDAVEQAKYLCDKDSENAVFLSAYAIESLQAGDFETAFTTFDKVLDKLPGDPNTLTSRGHALKTFGRQKDAIASYLAAIRAKADHGDAYYALANLKTYRFADEEVAAMLAQENTVNTTYRNRIHLCFALGKSYEDRKNYEKSFDYYKRGNDLKRQQSGYDADKMSTELHAQTLACTKELFDLNQGHGSLAPDPIFIVGLPRAGSTLLEQILASHSQVDGTLELPNILAMAHRLRGRGNIGSDTKYPDNLFTLSEEQRLKLGKAYLEDTRLHRKRAPFFTDKMPNNFRHIGLIHMILPNAKIIDARRHPMSCCFSGFKQLFAEGQEFTYGLEEIGRYYKDYIDLMNHWESVLPNKILRVQYEDVVADLDKQVRLILDYCGLPFEQACIDFHKNERDVRTASSEQVRQPINTKGLAQWENFEPYLDELKSALGNSLNEYLN